MESVHYRMNSFDARDFLKMTQGINDAGMGATTDDNKSLFLPISTALLRAKILPLCKRQAPDMPVSKSIVWECGPETVFLGKNIPGSGMGALGGRTTIRLATSVSERNSFK